MQPGPAHGANEDWERRRLGVGTASILVIANMIGVGLFTTSGFALADLGDPRWVVLAWAVGGVLALCGALSYGGIAHRIPLSGGEATYLGRAAHPALGFLAGWVSLFAGFTGPIAAAALGLEAYLASATGMSFPTAWTGASVIALAAIIHAVRPEIGTLSLNALVVFKVFALLSFVAWGTASIETPPSPAPVALDWGAFGVTLVWVSFSYSGWNGAIYLAGEIRDPARNLRRALWMPTLGVAALYVATNALFVGAGPAESIAGRPDVGAAAAGLLGGPSAERAVAAIIVVALLTSISVMVLSGPRVLAQMARDGLLPAWLARGKETPIAAIGLQAGLAITFLFLSELSQLIATLGFALGLSAAATVGAAAWMRHREGAEAVPIPGYPWVPLVYLTSTLAASALLVHRNPGEAAVGTGFLLAGLPAYYWQRHRSAATQGSMTQLTTETRRHGDGTE